MIQKIGHNIAQGIKNTVIIIKNVMVSILTFFFSCIGYIFGKIKRPFNFLIKQFKKESSGLNKIKQSLNDIDPNISFLKNTIISGRIFLDKVKQKAGGVDLPLNHTANLVSYMFSEPNKSTPLNINFIMPFFSQLALNESTTDKTIVDDISDVDCGKFADELLISALAFCASIRDGNSIDEMLAKAKTSLEHQAISLIDVLTNHGTYDGINVKGHIKQFMKHPSIK